MAEKILGAHLTSNAVKLVELEQQAKGYKVLNWSVDYLSSETIGDPHINAISSAIKKHNISARQAIVVLSGTDIIYKLIEMPILPDKEIPSALKYELEAVLTEPIEDPVIDYYKIEGAKQKDKQSFFVVATSKSKIINVIRVIKKAGLSLKGIIPSSSALRNTCELAGREPGVLICLGKYYTVIVLDKDGKAVFAREAAMGGEGITQSLVGEVVTEAGKIELDYNKAEELKDTFGIPLNAEEYTRQAKIPAAKIMEMMRPALEKIPSEIFSTLDYYRTETGDQTEFKKIYLTGGASKTKNLLEYLNAELDFNIAPFPHKASLDVSSVGESLPLLTKALGAALSAKGDLSLLPKEYAKMTTAKIFSYWTAGAAYLLILVLIWSAFALRQNALNAELVKLKDEFQQRQLKLAGTEPKISKLVKEIGVRPGKVDRFVKIIGHAHRSIPGNVYLENVNYDNKNNQLIIKGIALKAHGQKMVTNFIGELKKNAYFASVSLSYLTESDRFAAATYEFELKCGLAEGKP